MPKVQHLSTRHPVANEHLGTALPKVQHLSTRHPVANEHLGTALPKVQHLSIHTTAPRGSNIVAT